MSGTDELILAAEFPAATHEQWRALVAKIVDKSGAQYPAGQPEQALASRTHDGIAIAPLYPAGVTAGAPGAMPFTRGRTADGIRHGWDVRAQQGNPDVKIAHEQILEDLAGGASSLWLRVGAAGTPTADLGAALDEVLLDLIAVALDGGVDAIAAARAYLSLAAEGGFTPQTLSGTLGVDPLAVLARTGNGADLREAGAFAAQVAGTHPGLRTITVDALAFHEAGATDAQELGASLAAGVAYLRALTDAGLSVEDALKQIEFRYAVTADQFAGIAKLRAARRCWARIAEVSGVSTAAAGQRQHAVSSWPMMTRQDPWTNMLRGTLACFAACVGGADAVTVLPFDAALGLPDPLARRIARNTPALLVEESHIAKVIDPAGGSGYVESLTESLARAAWAEFTGIETGGGIVTALSDGSLATRIGEARAARLEAVTEKRETILGVNAFPLAGEHLLERTPAPKPPGGGLPRIRWSDMLEATGV
ncbi:MAG: methylmalonyl-CoA mutase subunit beta [Sporichthyaceae bacterium]